MRPVRLLILTGVCWAAAGLITDPTDHTEVTAELYTITLCNLLILHQRRDGRWE